VDRGPESRRAKKFLEQPWVYAVRGNHEGMFLELYEDGDHPNEAVVEFVTSRNGMSWWRNLSQDERMALIAEFRKMPVAIEIATRRGTVGLVHAEVPAGMDWQTFLERIEADDQAVIKQALWGRSRVRGDDRGIAGVGRVFVGHTPVARLGRLGNVYYIDTGAVFGLLDGNPVTGRLTMAEITGATVILTKNEAAEALVDTRNDDGAVSAPFGNYARP
jgi:serine/threonine protein phosphatase 1